MKNFSEKNPFPLSGLDFGQEIDVSSDCFDEQYFADNFSEILFIEIENHSNNYVGCVYDPKFDENGKCYSLNIRSKQIYKQGYYCFYYDDFAVENGEFELFFHNSWVQGQIVFDFIHKISIMLSTTSNIKNLNSVENLVGNRNCSY